MIFHEYPIPFTITMLCPFDALPLGRLLCSSKTCHVGGVAGEIRRVHRRHTRGKTNCQFNGIPELEPHTFEAKVVWILCYSLNSETNIRHSYITLGHPISDLISLVVLKVGFPRTWGRWWPAVLIEYPSRLLMRMDVTGLGIHNRKLAILHTESVEKW